MAYRDAGTLSWSPAHRNLVSVLLPSFLFCARIAVGEAVCTALGHNCYHMEEVRKNMSKKHVSYWHEAVVIKLYGKGKPYGPAEFDKILENYSVRKLVD